MMHASDKGKRQLQIEINKLDRMAKYIDSSKFKTDEDKHKDAARKDISDIISFISG